MKQARASRTGFASEAELARVVLDWLRTDGWTTYHEVEHPPRSGDIADIVATRGEEVVVVECKLGLNLTLFDQGRRWLRHAPKVWLAIPGYGGRGTRSIGRVICEALGLGLLEVFPPMFGTVRGQPVGRVHVAEEPKAQRVDPKRLLQTLRPEHQTTGEAGAPGGHRWTTFWETERALRAYVVAHPGCTARAAVKAIKHHWRGKNPAAQALARIRQGVLGGIRIQQDGRAAKLYPADGADGSGALVPDARHAMGTTGAGAWCLWSFHEVSEWDEKKRTAICPGCKIPVLTRAPRGGNGTARIIKPHPPAAPDAEEVEQEKLRAGIEAAYAAERAALDFLPIETAPQCTATSSPTTSSTATSSRRRRRRRAWQIGSTS